MKKLFIVLIALSAIHFSCNTKSNNNNNNLNEKTMTQHLTKAEFIEKVVDYESNPNEWIYKGDKPAIIDFYASWCGPCKMIAPILEELAEEYKDKIYVYKINTEEERELSAAFGIRSIPTLLFVPMEGQPHLAQGAMSKEAFKDAIENVLLKETK